MEKILAIIMSSVLGLLGVAFLIASPTTPGRVIIGIILILFAVLLLLITFRKKEQVIVKQQIEIGSTIDKKILKCQNCGAELSADSLKIEQGISMVHCAYCKAVYRLEEAPKW